ncbi:MAG: phenylalanine--tRNA ligase subunit alpha [Nitrososphaerales archaeon]
MTFDVRTLHPIERKIIKALANGTLTLDDLTQRTGLKVDQVRRGIEWLKFKKLINYSEKVSIYLSLGTAGKEAVQSGTPERILVNSCLSLGKVATILDVKERSGLDGLEFSAAISNAIAKGWIKLVGDKLDATVSDVEPESNEEKLLERLAKGRLSKDVLSRDELDAYESLKRRPQYIIEDQEKKIECELSQHGLMIVEEVKKQPETERQIDVTAPAPIIYAGRKHPLQDIIDEVREIFVGLGFQEIEGPLVQNSFWNFDALFTPQDHPAREMQDTFYIANRQSNNVADKKIVNSVSSIHRKGWHYKWNIKEARKLVLRTHTTPVTIRYLADKKPDEASIFSIGRVFRNEKLTYKHLAEFYQVEGIVVGEKVTLRDLMGLQTEFYYKMGLKKVKFWPSFFPYTEPSLQSVVYHEKLGKWVELFGMGIFRPEVTIPVGVKNPVLAWGGGLERIAMLRYRLDDVRELYDNKLGWLRSVPKCQL